MVGPAMCCFSRPVKLVAKTKIFARDEGGPRQALVYSMDVEIDEELAMVLPLPVPVGCAEDALRFVSLEGYPTFFADLDRAFPEMMFASQAKGGMLSRGGPPPAKLVVHDVGAFEASFVPSRADFARLDERFRLPEDAWRGLSGYEDWGFAVFRLKPKKGFFGGIKRQSVHPMAFSFPRRDPSAIFFPTVHVHDGHHVPDNAVFDHQLYVQGSPVLDAILGWREATVPLGATVDVDRAMGLVDGERRAKADMLFGLMKNTDTWLRVPAGVTDDDVRGRGESYRFTVKAAYGFYDAAFTEERHKNWVRTARTKLPAVCRALGEGLPALCAANREAWRLGPLDDALAPHFMNGPMLWKGSSWLDQGGEAPPGGPGRVKLTVFSEHVEPQDVELGFAELPDRERLGEIARAVCGLLDAVAG